MSLAAYYDRDGITVYNARWEDVVAAGLVPVRDIALIHGDPPYGSGRDANRDHRPVVKELPYVADSTPYDPAPLLSLKRPTVLWGANHYADRLPVTPSMILWDKRVSVPPDDNADGELAWTNLGGPLRIFRYVWRGFLRGGETGLHVHPHQKPIALSTYVFQRAKLKRGDLVFVPYLGSGPDLPAAVAMGLRVIACDVEEWCCRTAVARLVAAPHPEPVNALGPLFATAV